MDRPGDIDPHQHVGWGQDAAGAERDAQNWTHFFHHIHQDGRPGLLSNTRAVPDETEKAEVKLQAMLPKQVRECFKKKKGKAEQTPFFCWFTYVISFYLQTVAWKDRDTSSASFIMNWEEFWWRTLPQCHSWMKYQRSLKTATFLPTPIMRAVNGDESCMTNNHK